MSLAKKIRQWLWTGSVLGGCTAGACFGVSEMMSLGLAQGPEPAPRPKLILQAAGQAQQSGTPSAKTPEFEVPKSEAPPPTPPAPETPAPSAPTPAPSVATPAAPTFNSSAGGTGSVAPAELSSTQQSAAATPSTGLVSGGEATVRGTSDTGDLLGKSLGSIGVEIQRRSPIISEPRIRGYRLAEVVTVADGGFWIPVRPDLDTIVSKLDSSLIRNIVVVKGPFSVRHGPGFAFIDAETLGTPRYKCFEWHGSTSAGFKSNGRGWNGQQAIWGGGSDWGFRASYDALSGSDYRDGDGNRIPSSYNSHSFSFGLGMDLTENSHLELKAIRVNQRDIEIPGAVTDIARLYTDSFTGRLVIEDQPQFDRFTLDAWYNETRFRGDNLNESKRAFLGLNTYPVFDRVDLVEGRPRAILRPNPANADEFFPSRITTFSDGLGTSWGGRAATTWGKESNPQVTAGVDFRYVTQSVNELDNLLPINLAVINNTPFNVPIPRSNYTDPGLFLDISLPFTPYFKTVAGIRVDWHRTNVDRFTDQPFIQEGNEPNQVKEEIAALKDREFFLFSGFATTELKVTDQIVGTFGYGYSQRAPSLTELYAQRTFLALQQTGFAEYTGNDSLQKEELHQLDLGVRGNFDKVRTGLNGFVGMAKNYINYANKSAVDRIAQGITENTPLDNATLKAIVTSDAQQIRSYTFRNVSNVTFLGAEGYAELDVIEWLTLFGTFNVVQAYENSPKVPLPGIYPFSSRIGFRIHEAQKSPKWAIETSARMVAPQNQVASDSTTDIFRQLPTDLGEIRTPGFTVFDLRTYWQVRQNLLLTMGVENFADLGYREHFDIVSRQFDKNRALVPDDSTRAVGDSVAKRVTNFVTQPGLNFYVGVRWTY